MTTDREAPWARHQPSCAVASARSRLVLRLVLGRLSSLERRVERGQHECALRAAQTVERALTVDLEQRRPDVTACRRAEHLRGASAAGREATIRLHAQADVLDSLPPHVRVEARLRHVRESDATPGEVTVAADARERRKRTGDAVGDGRALWRGRARSRGNDDHRKRRRGRGAGGVGGHGATPWSDTCAKIAIE